MTEDSNQDRGIIYLLENEAFDAPVIKIGRTGRTGNDLLTRIRTLNTAVPLSFTCYHASLVDDPSTVEKKLHDVFAPAKRQWRGEFFEVEPWRVMLVLDRYEIEDMTTSAPVVSNEDLGSIDVTVKEKEKRTRCTFAMLDIPVGARLTLVGNPERDCEVANEDTGVLYEGELYALSTLATQLKESKYGLQGIRHWIYEDETLLKRRDLILERQAQT